MSVANNTTQQISHLQAQASQLQAQTDVLFWVFLGLFVLFVSFLLVRNMLRYSTPKVVTPSFGIEDIHLNAVAEVTKSLVPVPCPLPSCAYCGTLNFANGHCQSCGAPEP